MTRDERRIDVKYFPLAIGLILTAAGCGGAEVPVADSGPTVTTLPAVSPTSTAPTDDAAPSEDSLELVDDAVRDLAGRLGVAGEEVKVLEVEAVTWSDGSLGCPEPGMMYTQALVEGWRLTLAVEDDTYAYHSSSDGPPFLCERPSIDPASTDRYSS